MKRKNLFLWLLFLVGITCIVSTTAIASPGSSLLYSETDMGDGLWQYDYNFNNTSDAGESLYSVYFYFAPDTSFTGISLPDGWDGIVWDGTWTTSFADTSSTDASYDIDAGNSLSGFGFTVDYRAGNISYDAYLSGDNVVSGTTALVPEPISFMLFMLGGTVLSVRQYFRNKK